MILVSACLVGINCKYDGKNNFNEKIAKLVESGKAIPVCPEQLGGLSTPRIPAEIIGNKIFSKNGDDVSRQFQKGAEETLKIAKLVKCKKAILKENSPSCGVSKIYDGTFSGSLKSGSGIATKLLRENGILVLNEK